MSPRNASLLARSSAVVSNAVGPRALWAAPLVVAFAAVVAGCPIYAADTCEQDPSCNPPVANADAGGVDATPTPDTGGCGEGCDPGYVCTSLSTGRYACVAYDCRSPEKACTGGETCIEKSPGLFVCGTEPPTSTDCGTTGCIAGYECKGTEAGKKVCVSTDPNACVADADCASKTGDGSLCLGGTCKAPKDLCTDSTQCSAGATCVDGRCTPKCAATCATGYACDDATGLCTAGGGACSDTTACETGKSCVGGRCVAPCATDGSCSKGLACAGTSADPLAGGGCVVDDRPVFFCDKDGTKEGTQDTCKAGSICLHHNCYIACTGPEDTTTCATADKLNVCKSVTTGAGRFNVCGSSTSLGSECDPTSTPPKTCSAGKVCIDGFCK